MKCPTCGRRPSERHATQLDMPRQFYEGREWRRPSCGNPIHDAADLGPEALAFVRLYARFEDECKCGACDPCAARALLARLEVKP